MGGLRPEALTGFRLPVRRSLIELVVAAAMFAGFSAVFLRHLLVGKEAYVALDLAIIHIPFRDFLRQSLASGQLPLWNPDLYLGMPFLANGDAAVAYPLQF